MADKIYSVADGASKKLRDMEDGSHAEVISSVISDPEGQMASVTDHLALQVTPPAEGKAAFGEALSAQLSPIIQLNFAKFVNPDVSSIYSNQSGTVTGLNGMAVISSGAAANSSARLLSRDSIRYSPGLGTRIRFTALFTTGVANSSQMAGIGDSGNGYFFGFDGATFGLLHRKGGLPEVRTLTISTKSSNDENITITLDGDSTGDTVAVTNGADATVTASEIAAHDYSDVGRGWIAKAVGSTVIFMSYDSAVHTGGYSLSSATSADGSFAQTLAGVAPTDTWIPQTSWNGNDIFDGNGLTGVTLDPTKGNVFQIVFQYLGFGAITFAIEAPDDGDFHTVHTISYANANTAPSLGNPTLPLTIISENASNTTDLVIKSGSMAAFVDGNDPLVGARRTVAASVTLGATSAETPFLTLLNRAVFQSTINRVEAKLLHLTASADHTKPIEVRFYRNAILVGATFAVSVPDSSVILLDEAATSFTGGELLYSIPIEKAGSGAIDLSMDHLAGIILPGETITVTIKPKSGNSAEATVTARFVEMA